jgi:hypothetical protein
MRMILLDWTRMGTHFCLAGVVIEGKSVRTVRPLPERFYDGRSDHCGWPESAIHGHRRWEIVELVGASPAETRPPHREDMWVQELGWQGELAAPAQRREVLRRTAALSSRWLFGVPLNRTRASAYLVPGSGERSLATIVVPSRGITFLALQRVGINTPCIRVQLSVAGLGDCELPVIDHHLLLSAEEAGARLGDRLDRLQSFLEGMGEQVVIRLGLARPLNNRCWLMADGFFSLADPQP